MSVSGYRVVDDTDTVGFNARSLNKFGGIAVSGVQVGSAFHSTVTVRSISKTRVRGIRISGIRTIGAKGTVFVHLNRHSNRRPNCLQGMAVGSICIRIPFNHPSVGCSLHKPTIAFFRGPFPDSVSNVPKRSVRGIGLRGVRVIYPKHTAHKVTCVSLDHLGSIPRGRGKCPRFAVFRRLPS